MHQAFSFLFFSFEHPSLSCVIWVENLWAGRSLVKEGRLLEKKVGLNTEGQG